MNYFLKGVGYPAEPHHIIGACCATYLLDVLLSTLSGKWVLNSYQWQLMDIAFPFLFRM